jgi:GTP-binding protein EngB required for normal cell division
MSTIELRNKVIDKIRKIENEDLLNEVNRLIEIETSDIEVYKFSNEQKVAIEEAENQIKNGEFLTDEEATKDIEEWLKK